MQITPPKYCFVGLCKKCIGRFSLPKQMAPKSHGCGCKSHKCNRQRNKHGKIWFRVQTSSGKTISHKCGKVFHYLAYGWLTIAAWQTTGKCNEFGIKWVNKSQIREHSFCRRGVGVGQRNLYEHECKISQPSLYIFCWEMRPSQGKQ